MDFIPLFPEKEFTKNSSIYLSVTPACNELLSSSSAITNDFNIDNI